MSKRYDMQLPLVAHVRHSVRNLELLTNSLVEGTMSWPHELIVEPNADTRHAPCETYLLRTSVVTACVVHQATRRS